MWSSPNSNRLGISVLLFQPKVFLEFVSYTGLKPSMVTFLTVFYTPKFRKNQTAKP